MSILSAGTTRTGLSVAILAIATLYSAAPSASAQRPALRVNVPFNFEVGSQHLDSGHYTMQLQPDHILLIRSSSHSTFTMPLQDESRQAAKASVVIFRRYGNHTFMREIHLAGRSTYLKCAKSRSERRLEVAGNTPPAADFEVASLDPSH